MTVMVWWDNRKTTGAGGSEPDAIAITPEQRGNGPDGASHWEWLATIELPDEVWQAAARRAGWRSPDGEG